MNFSFWKKHGKRQLHTIAFYNLENLFDTNDDHLTLDDDFTPNGIKQWTPKRYEKKLRKLANTISRVGLNDGYMAPIVVGICEVENRQVVEDLIATEPLKNEAYGIVHYDSPDERGIDCALIYNKEYFKLISSEPIHLKVHQTDGSIDRTRDILYVKGTMKNETLHIFVNHWPSRRDGGTVTSPKRMKAAQTLSEFIARLQEKEPQMNCIVMGDFNDGPKSNSLRHLKQENGLYNPMEKLLTPNRGSATYKGRWMLFDQILISHSFLNYEKGTHSFSHANIFDDYFLTEFKGKYKGSPFRTYAGRKYLGGLSDHFPVYIHLKYNT
ncbi:endonuclease/exonuclease/phosphatase family protein [Euzebyella saccharophila]|uniref:Endonuclease/exonuclease/phosphatase family protein n=1 Tax=Euzebyella saccharophila TaxID=679664 RepID=A0ABV8JMX9_9FLAO|nr:endonuclease/exonuclease/phosphatase family protein [Euzebyella saccharophila]